MLYRSRNSWIAVYQMKDTDGTLNTTCSFNLAGDALLLLLEPKGGPKDVYGKFLVDGRVGWIYWPDVELVEW